MSQKKNSIEVLASPKDFFQSAVETALVDRQVQALPLTKTYLSGLLEHYLFADNLFEVSEETGKRSSGTLAELYLKASQSVPAVRVELLKKLGDTSLYISGFFGDSLKKKIVDVDYYAQMGGAAYGTLAEEESDSIYSPVFRDFARRFLEYVDVLTLISQQAFAHSSEDLLRLYDRYMLTGSKLAREKLVEKGMLNPDLTKAKNQKQ
ncbi:MAG: hypothetical protein KDD22_05115 [Bdellovibrionales bacterium]|nr:hypothetical protein [Bdellovibrionales bacterium]